MVDHLLQVQMEILMICRFYGEPLPMEVAHALTMASPEDLKQAILLSAERKWLEWTTDSSVSLGAKIPNKVLKSIDSMMSPALASEMIDRTIEKGLFDQVSTKLIGNLYLATGREHEGAAQLYEQATKQAQKRNLKTAEGQCRECIRLLQGRLDERDVCGLFLDASLLLSELCHTLRINYSEARQIQENAEKVALRLGDQRRLAMIHFHRGRTLMLSHMLDQACQEMERGFEIVADLGDEDMVARSSGFRAYYYYLHGLCRESAEAPASLSLGSSKVFDPHIPIMLAMSSVFMGNLSRAVGIMESSWGKSLLEGWNSWSRIFLQALLGQVLVMCRRMDEALNHLREAESAAQDVGDLVGLFWTRRAIAYHHFATGQFHESYKTLNQCVSDARNSGVGKIYYGIPWFLEMLAQFHRMGYESIPGCEYSAEIEAALNGPNILLRGVALRIRAKEIYIGGADLKDACALLLKSESELERSGATFELAKTRAELALLELAGNAEEAAKKLALKAWDDWAEFEKEEFPDELSALIGSQELQDADSSSAKKLLGRYMNLVQSLIVQQDPEGIQFQLLNATCEFFDAERGGIFSLERTPHGEEIVLLKGLNMTKSQARESYFQGNLQIIQRSYLNWQPIITRLPNMGHESICHVLCLPIRIGENAKVVLYYDRRYIQQSLEPFDEATLAQIAQHLEKFILRSLENIVRQEEKTTTILGALTKGKNREDDLSMFFGPAFRDLIARVRQVAPSDASVLTLGETGVGKGFLARNIHDMSHRKAGPFVSVDPSSIPENLVESELFGHEKGAFTGADRQKQGLMELANKGTLFIDEIGEIPKAVQVKLLRVIEEKSFMRVGGVVKRTVDFRLIVATNRDLVKEVEEGNFREDLYYRLCVVPLIVPPLRERGDDVVRLAEKFLAQYANKYNRSVPILSAEQKAMLKAYHWPGNIRELRNVIERSIILSDSHRLDLAITPAPKKAATAADPVKRLFADHPTLDDLQRRYIQHVLKETGGKLSGPSGAAEILGIKRTTLHNRMKKLNLKD